MSSPVARTVKLCNNAIAFVEANIFCMLSDCDKLSICGCKEVNNEEKLACPVSEKTYAT